MPDHDPRPGLPVGWASVSKPYVLLVRCPQASRNDEPAQVPVSFSSRCTLLSLEPSNISVSGHRKQSFICLDDDELVELRASQRTYNGAYVRTALGILGYALTVLRLFGRRFYRSMSAPPSIFSS